VRCLAFEDEAEAQSFCQHHNLAVTEGCMVIDKAAFVEPESRLPDTRAPKLIEAKQVGRGLFSIPRIVVNETGALVTIQE
jgi:hypothetical protein